MAEEKKKEEPKKEEAADKATAPAAASGAGKKKIIFIALGLVGLVLLIGVPVAIFALKGSGSNTETELAANAASSSESHGSIEGSHDEDQLEEGEEGFGAFFPLEPFVVNLNGGRFIRCQIQLEFVEREVPKRFYARLVPVRDNLLGMLTRRTQDELLTDKGKEDLKKAVKDSINEIMKKEEVKRVYFTQFVIQ